MNQLSAYWYMGSMLARSDKQKNRMEEYSATGLYPNRVVSISCSVALAIACFSVISSDSILEEDNT